MTTGGSLDPRSSTDRQAVRLGCAGHVQAGLVGHRGKMARIVRRAAAVVVVPEEKDVLTLRPALTNSVEPGRERAVAVAATGRGVAGVEAHVAPVGRHPVSIHGRARAAS